MSKDKNKVEDIKKFLTDKNLQFYESETHFQVDCFLCTDTRKRLGISKTVSTEKDADHKWACFNCNSRAKKFSSFKYSWDHKGEIKTKHDVVKDEQEEKCTIKAEFHKQFIDYLNKTDRYESYNYLIDERKLSPKCIKFFELGARKTFTSASGNSYKPGEHLAIPYIKDGKCVNIKYRAIDPNTPKEDKWRREKGGVSSLFNDQVLDNLDYKSIFITEAEIDAMSLWTIGIKNVVGLTVGAKGFKKSWTERLRRFERIYLVLDRDQAGQEGAEKLATRLGKGRCYNIVLPEDVKDPNDFIKKYKLEDFNKLADKAEQFQVRGVVSASSSLKQLVHDRDHGDKKDHGFTTRWAKMNKVMGTMKPGNLIILSAPPKVGKCVSASSIIYDTKTLVPTTIEMAIKNKMSHVHSYNEDTKKIEIKKISNWIDSGVKPLVRIETALGRSIETTYGHRYLTFDGWKYVADLKEGDSIAVPRKYDFFGDKTWTKNKCHVISAIIADGSIGNNTTSPGYTKEDPTVVGIIRKALKEEYNIELVHASMGKQHKDNEWRLNGSERLKKDLAQMNLLGKLSKEKHIPDEVFSLEESCIKEFIGMLWSHDGSIFMGHTMTGIEYSSASEILIDGLNHLLIRFGINLKKRHKKIKLNDKVFDAWMLSSNQSSVIRKFVHTFPLYGEKANREVNTSDAKERDYLTSYPKEIWKFLRERSKFNNISWNEVSRKVSNGNGFKENGRCSIFMLRRINKLINDCEIKKLIDSDICFIKISKIKDIGEHRCYDLTVPGNENFICNDIVAHNTSWALDMTADLAEQGIPVGIYSCEMQHKALTEKLISRDLYTGFVQGMWSFEDVDDIDLTYINFKMQTILANFFMYYPEMGDLELVKVVDRITEMVERYGLKFVVFDNLHLLCRGEDEKALIDKATQAFKLLAENLQVVFILIVQPRKVANENKAITTGDLKGSSSIYQDADLVILMHRRVNNGDMLPDEIENGVSEGAKSPRTEFNITGRFVEGGKTYLAFNGSRNTFKDSGTLYNTCMKELMGKKKKKGF